MFELENHYEARTTEVPDHVARAPRRLSDAARERVATEVGMRPSATPRGSRRSPPTSRSGPSGRRRGRASTADARAHRRRPSGDYASIDGRVATKSACPSTPADAKGGKASRWIRMAQPYAGRRLRIAPPAPQGHRGPVASRRRSGSAHHHRRGAEPAHGEPVTSANATQSVTHTASGIRIEAEDLANEGSRFAKEALDAERLPGGRRSWRWHPLVIPT